MKNVWKPVGTLQIVTGIYQIRREQVKGPRARDSKKSGVGIRAAYIRVLGVDVDSIGPGRAADKKRYILWNNIQFEVNVVIME